MCLSHYRSKKYCTRCTSELVNDRICVPCTSAALCAVEVCPNYTARGMLCNYHYDMEKRGYSSRANPCSELEEDEVDQDELSSSD